MYRYFMFLVDLKNASRSLNLTALSMQLDLVTPIPNLQSELKNVENWQNGGLNALIFYVFLAFLNKMASNYLLICTNMSSAKFCTYDQV